MALLFCAKHLLVNDMPKHIELAMTDSPAVVGFSINLLLEFGQQVFSRSRDQLSAQPL
jgi:hypothetical protein